MDKGLKEAKEKLVRELVPYVQMKDISNSNLDTIYKTVKTIYYLTTMEAMDDYSQDSYRRMETSMDMGSYMSGYNRGYSEARRGRDGDGDGRYNESASYGYQGYGYSGHDAKEHMIMKMEEMMQKLEPRDQKVVQECISRIK